MNLEEKILKKSMKKRRKLQLFLPVLDEIKPEKVLELGCAARAFSRRMHSRGDFWVSADLDFPVVKNFFKFNGNPAVVLNEKLPFRDSSFDLVLLPDFLEHVEEDELLLDELHRVCKDNGWLLLTVPRNGKLFINKVRSLIGLEPEIYGHKRAGYSLEELKEKLDKKGFHIVEVIEYSGFFLEVWETLLNFFYYKVFSRKKKLRTGQISPVEEEDFRKVKKVYRFYALLYPVALFAELLDKIFFFLPRHVIFVKAKNKV